MRQNAAMTPAWRTPGTRTALALVLACATLSACSLLSARAHAGETIAVTADEVAAAMASERFETDYRDARLLVSGTVKAIMGQGGETIVTLATAAGPEVLCDIGASPMLPRGQIVVTAAEVERRDSGIFLDGCRIVPPATAAPDGSGGPADPVATR